ncbi:MAG: lysylphosphatidylglycerol synthase domain-containing protein [Gemmatimonadota bacterium]
MKAPKWLVRLGQLVLIVAVTYGILRALAPELDKVSASDFAAWTPNAVRLALSLLMLLAVYLMHCLLWRTITTQLGGVQPGVQSALRIYFVSSLGRYIPGKLWQIAGLATLAQKAGISILAATAASLAGQFAFLTSGLVYLALLLPGWGGSAPIAAALALLGMGIGTFLLFTARMRERLVARFERFGGALRLFDRITWRHALQWWLAYAFTWALLGTAFVVFVAAFIRVSWPDSLHIAGSVAAAYLFGYVAFFSPAGLGIREAVMLGLLSQVMPASAALVVSVGSRLWFTAAELLPLALISATRDR